MPRVLSIQSHVADGHVGNAAAVLPMQRLGIEVLPVHTLQLSNHPGHGAFRGRVFEASHVAEVLEGLEAHGSLASCDAVLTGYLGSAAIAEVVRDVVARARSLNPSLVYVCDPVIGDAHKGVYVRPDLADAIRDRLVPLADFLLPNQFELQFLTGIDICDAASLRAAAERLTGGVRSAVVTSVTHGGIAAPCVATALFDARGTEVIETRRIDRQFSGAGDCFAALFTAYRLVTGDNRAAHWQAATAMASLLSKTERLGRDELALVEGQGAFRLRSLAELSRAHRQWKRPG
ncbi:MAG TPA: pyridoxal kinase [Beijerinckiaceae bacterium]|nr:pyridoxal kinase [Beijerinckiaceae bacterium]